MKTYKEFVTEGDDSRHTNPHPAWKGHDMLDRSDAHIKKSGVSKVIIDAGRKAAEQKHAKAFAKGVSHDKLSGEQLNHHRDEANKHFHAGMEHKKIKKTFKDSGNDKAGRAHHDAWRAHDAASNAHGNFSQRKSSATTGKLKTISDKAHKATEAANKH